MCRAVATGSVDAAQALSGPCPSIRLALQLRTKLFANFAKFALICVAGAGSLSTRSKAVTFYTRIFLEKEF